MGDYDDAADRAEDEVPQHMQEQSQIRDYLEQNYPLDQGGKVDRADKLYDEVSRRIEHSRQGAVDPSTGERVYYNPGSGRWQEEGGLFTGDPFDE